MKKIWTSQLPKGLKLRFFHAAIETILLYGCESWTLNKAMTKSTNGCYTTMLRMAQNVSWRDHITNLELVTVYGTQSYQPIKSSCGSPLTAGAAPEDPTRPS